MTVVIDGKAVAERVRSEVAAEVKQFVERHGRAPGLHVILAGDDGASAVYVRNKEKAAREVGMHGEVHRLPASVRSLELLALLEGLNRDERVDGILVQLPLPVGVDSLRILDAVRADKDVDGFHPVNVHALWTGRPGSVPCTPRGCMRLLQEAKVATEGARAVVVGRSNIVGKPMAALLLQANATVTIAHSRTPNLPELCREADILVAAVGKARFVTADFVKPGAAVLDVGINRDQAGKLCGDVDFESVSQVASAITPVPGGVGPMTIAMLLDNTLKAAKARIEHQEGRAASSGS